MSDAQQPPKKKQLREAPVILSPQDQEHVQSPFYIGGTHEENNDDVTLTVGGSSYTLDVEYESWESGQIFLSTGTYTATASVGNATSNVEFIVDADPVIKGDRVTVENEPEYPKNVDELRAKKKRLTFILQLKHDVTHILRAKLYQRGRPTDDVAKITKHGTQAYKIAFSKVEPGNYAMIIYYELNDTRITISRLVRAKKP